MGPIFFSRGDSHTKGMLFLLHLRLEGMTEVDTDPDGRFVSWLAGGGGGRFLEGLQNYMRNKNEGNENKIVLCRLKWYYG